MSIRGLKKPSPPPRRGIGGRDIIARCIRLAWNPLSPRSPHLRLWTGAQSYEKTAMTESVEKVSSTIEKHDRPEPADQISITHHRAKIGRKQIAYMVTCGTLVMKEEAEKEGKSEGEKARAKVFFIAYTLDGAADKATRPVTFSFNGGPGSSSVWLHLGVLGPKRVALDDEAYAPAPPARLVANEISLLDVSALGVIDPVG